MGPYELLEELGRGGMGRVHRARHRATGAIRALKVIEAVDPEQVVRFRREAELLARAGGSGIVAIHDSGAEGRRLWYSMDLLEGGSLRKLVGRVDAKRATALVREIAAALARCHALGIVHRDLKPENILLDDAGRLHIADFGCARDLGSSALTETGTLLGTPAYMAPEQHVDGKRVDARADVFALGVILHELATGERPFKGATPFDVFKAIQKEARNRVPGLEDILDHALAASAADRPADAGELVALLDDPRPFRRRSLLAPAAALAALVGVVLTTAAIANRSPPAPSTPLAPPTRPPTPPPPEPPPHLPAEEPFTAKAPAWFEKLPEKKKPPRLPEGVFFHKRLEGVYVNAKDGTELVWVPGPRPFFIGRLEVTREQYERFVKAAGYAFQFDAYRYVGVDNLIQDLAASWAQPHGLETKPAPGDPVVQVSWHDARAYAAWAKLRLPGSSEWRRAALVDPDSPEERTFPWGDDMDAKRGNMRDRSFARTFGKDDHRLLDDGFARAAPVGSFPRGASAVGALDMFGNVKEICEPDDARDRPEYRDQQHGNGAATIAINEKKRAVCVFQSPKFSRVCGMSWTSSLHLDNVTWEAGDGCGTAREDVGFRLARDP